jgi:hypothetical protein
MERQKFNVYFEAVMKA